MLQSSRETVSLWSIHTIEYNVILKGFQRLFNNREQYEHNTVKYDITLFHMIPLVIKIYALRKAVKK